MSSVMLHRSSGRVATHCSSSQRCTPVAQSSVRRPTRVSPLTLALSGPGRPSGAGRSSPDLPPVTDDSIPVIIDRPSGAGRSSIDLPPVKDDSYEVNVDRPSGASRGGGPGGNGGSGGGNGGGDSSFNGPLIFLLLGLLAGGAYAYKTTQAKQAAK